MATIAITLSACGGSNTESSAPVEVIVITPTGQDNLPLAVADSFSTDQNIPLTADLAANDTGLEDSPVSFRIDTPANNGAVTINENGSVRSKFSRMPWTGAW